jgi:ATP-binding cassette subfamily F protein uup
VAGRLLRDFRGSVLFITHDRSFLDNVATRIIELDRGRLLSFPGNFSAPTRTARRNCWRTRKSRTPSSTSSWRRKKSGSARACKPAAPVTKAACKRLEQLRLQRSARRDQQGQVKLDVSTGDRSGKIVAELIEVSKILWRQVIVNDFSATILRGDKVGLIGPNGAGKTTLLKLIWAKERLTAAPIRQGARLADRLFRPDAGSA